MTVEEFLLKLVVLAVIGLGVYGSVLVIGVFYSLPMVGYAVLTKPAPAKRKKKPASLYSPSSTKSMLAAETVHEFVTGLGDADKREEYLSLLDGTKKLLLDMSKRPEQYPDDQFEFAWTQLKKNIAKSRVAESVETAKFKQMAERFMQAEVARMQGGTVWSN